MLNDPTNGTVIGNSVSFGSKVTYTCNNGYILSGNNSRMCQDDGQWTGSAPVCNSKYLS